MIKTHDGTSFRRVGGLQGDRTPLSGFQRQRATYTATGGETSINLSALTPNLSYFPGQNQLEVKRSSGGVGISGLDFLETNPTTVSFPASDPLIAGEIVEITCEFAVSGVMAVAPRPDMYTATATAGQTLVNASFSWTYNLNPTQGVGGVEVYLNGVLQTRGVDYTEVNLGAANTSQIQFVDSLVGGENIVLKPTYQVLDQSAAASTYLGTQVQKIQDEITAGFQGFVDQSTNTMAVPSTQIINRARIPDLTKDLRCSMGVERIPTQRLIELQNEFGPNGERVVSALNDDRGLIRFIGTWAASIDNHGPKIYTTDNVSTLEVTFYGTGLNLLRFNDPSSNGDLDVSVDGGAFTTFSTLPYSNVLAGRNYAENHVLSVVHGLSLGVHTVTLRKKSNSFFQLYGVEIVNAASSINVNLGTGYINGQKNALLSAQTIAYNSSFETGALGTRGGRVVVYLKSDGTIGKSVQPVNPSQANLTSADHTNEEVIRTHHFREFGAGRSDDFSTFQGLNSASRQFTLEDGTTSLAFATTASGGVGFNDPLEALQATGGGNFIALTFVGTGIDVTTIGDGGVRGFDAYIDGTLVGTHSNTDKIRTVKIVSGLPYGTHVLKLLNGTNSGIGCARFTIYGPKKPSVPTGAIELADYNVLANYSAVVSADAFSVSGGTLRKAAGRELGYVGSGWAVDAISNSVNDPSGQNVRTATNGDYVTYTFFGTGFEALLRSGASSTTATVQIDGVNYTGAATAVGGSWVPGTSTYNTGTSSGCRLQVTGLSLGVHTVKITRTTATDSLVVSGFDIITPIHSAKPNLYADLQNTLPIGSCAISDNRRTTAIKEAIPAQKAWAQAVGIASGISTTSTVFVPMTDMSVTLKITSNRAMVNFWAHSRNQNINQNQSFQLYIDGAAVGNPAFVGDLGNTFGSVEASINRAVILSPGVHKFDIYWKVSGGTVESLGTWRELTISEL